MMSLHSSKKLALLQLTNCMPSCNVTTIKELSDGKIFLSIIETVFPEKIHNLKSEEKQAVHVQEHSKDEDKPVDKENDSELNSVVESNTVTEPAINGNESIAAETNSTVVCNESDDIVTTVTESLEHISIDVKEVIISEDNKSSSPVENVDEKDEDLLKRYKFIECFIDEKYNLQSGSIISYEGCMAEDEYELAKVTFFVVSEVVRYYVRLNNAVIQTLSLLDMKVQQDLEDCFNLFINERAKITEADLKSLLSNPAKYKVSPNKSSFVTPKRSCSSKYKRSTSPSTSPFDSVFTDSPLKTYFESPIFTKKDIITKEKEILKTRQTLYEEESKSNTLQLTVNELEKKLKNKDKEIKSLKGRIKEFEETERLEDCENCAILSNSLKEKEKLLHEVKIENDEVLESLKNSCDEKLEIYQVQFSDSLQMCNYEFRQAESRCQKLEVELDDVKFELMKKEQDIERLVEELEEKTKECEISKEKLSAALIEIEKIPEYSIRGESIGGVIEKENEELRQRISQLELISLSKEKIMVDALVMCTEDEFECKVMENSMFSNNELPPAPNMCEKTESVIISESPNKSNLSPIKNDRVGALWLQYNESINESENEGNLLEKCVSKVLSSLQKFETEFFNQNNKHIKITCRANGSNGLVRSPATKKLMEDLKSFKKSLLCLSEVVKKSDVKFQNNILIPNSSEVNNENGCDSNLVVDAPCDTCLRREEELPISAPSLANRDSAALLEKAGELDALNEQYRVTVSSLKLKEKELDAYKRKFILEKRENLNNVKILKDLEITCQKLRSELNDVKMNDYRLKKGMKKEKILYKMQIKDMYEKYKKLAGKYNDAQAHIKILRERNEMLKSDVDTYRTQNEELNFNLKILENQAEELGHPPTLEPIQNTNVEVESGTVPYTQALQDPPEHFAPVISKTRPLSPDEYGASSLNANNEGSISSCALYTRSLQNPFHLHTADEESFLNHSSIAGLSRNYESEDSVNRMQELNRRNTLCMPHTEAYIHNQNYEQIPPNRVTELSRRNTLCMPHLQSCYPAEGLPLNFHNKHSSNYVDYENVEVVPRGSELESKEPAGKKRKVSEMKAEDQPSDVASTPSSSTRFRTLLRGDNKNLKKLLQYRKNKKIQPKLE